MGFCYQEHSEIFASAKAPPIIVTATPFHDLKVEAEEKKEKKEREREPPNLLIYNKYTTATRVFLGPI